MAYAQWIIVAITNALKSSKDLQVKNAATDWGKFWKGQNKDDEISAAAANIVIAPATSGQVQSCGRSDAASGTTGSFDIYEGETKICHVSWNCPWGSKSNQFDVQVEDAVKSMYIVIQPRYILDSGAIGTVPIVIMNR